MTDTHDDTEDDDPIADGPASGPFARGLWRDARWWLHQAVIAFGPMGDIAAGLSRSLGRRLSAWLYAIEGATRRLILAAAVALQLDRSARPPRSPSARKPSPARTRSIAFRVFALCTPRAPTTETQPSEADPSATGPAGAAAWRHIAYPADPLLRIGADAMARTASGSARRHRRIFRPLHTYLQAAPAAFGDDDHLRAAIVRARPSGPRRHLTHEERMQKGMELAHRDGLYALAERDAARIIPAPHLARRLEALVALMRNPQAAIDRTARRLASADSIAARLAAAPEPVLRQPVYEKRPMPARELLEGAWALWPPPDTS